MTNDGGEANGRNKFRVIKKFAGEKLKWRGFLGVRVGIVEMAEGFCRNL